MTRENVHTHPSLTDARGLGIQTKQCGRQTRQNIERGRDPEYFQPMERVHFEIVEYKRSAECIAQTKQHYRTRSATTRVS